MRVALGLLMLGIFSATTDPGPDAARLAARLELLRQGGVYLESTENALEVYAGGWKVRRFPARILEISRGKTTGVAQIEQLAPLDPAPAAVIDSEEIAAESENTDSDVSTLDQIIGVDKMPESYVAYFDDGSIWVVNPGEWIGLSRLWRKGELQFRMARHLLRQAFDLEGIKISFLSMDPESAQHVYWILEERMPVVQ